MPSIQQYHDYQFGSLARLSEDQMATLIRHLNVSPTATDTVLGGRHQPVGLDLAGYGPVTIKKYMRGGAIRHLNRQTHVKWESTRPQAEFDLLNRVRQMGVNAPEPVTYVTKGGWLYQGWLVTRTIMAAKSLVTFTNSDPTKAKAVVSHLTQQVSVLMDHRILHTDLHPGNVLIDQDGKAYIIDFDKARADIDDREKLRSRYKERWRRAVKKYGLPEWLDTEMTNHL